MLPIILLLSDNLHNFLVKDTVYTYIKVCDALQTVKTSRELSKPVYYGIASRAIPTDQVIFAILLAGVGGIM